MKRIAVEEAFCTPALYDALKDAARAAGADAAFKLMAQSVFGESKGAAQIREQLFDLGAGRLAHMDELGISSQLVSVCSPGVQGLPPEEGAALAREANDALAAATRQHPGRLFGLTAVAPLAISEAVAEVERGATKLGMRGIIINSHSAGRYLDESFFMPLLEAAASLQQPIYLHPREPSPGMAGPYLDHGLYFAGWGFAAETGLHALRLIMSGVFERLPSLRIVLGHLGEGIPYYLDRIDNRYLLQVKLGVVRKLERLPSEYFRSNFVVTTSGMVSAASLRLCLEVLGSDRILFAADHPYESTAEAVAFHDNAGLDADTLARIYHRNAERVFRLPPE